MDVYGSQSLNKLLETAWRVYSNRQKTKPVKEEK